MIRENRVALLHPPILETAIRTNSTERSDRILGTMEYVRQLLEEAADMVGHKIAVDEFPLFYDASGELTTPGRRRRRLLTNSDTTIVIDPSDSVLSFASSKADHPARRAIIVETERNAIDEKTWVLSALQATILGPPGKTRRTQQTFAMHVSRNEEIASLDFESNRKIAEKALRYPED